MQHTLFKEQSDQQSKAPCVPLDKIVGKPSNNLLPCPCGKVPDKLVLSDAGQGGKRGWVDGGCCGEWSLEFRTDYHDLDTDECYLLAVKQWNNAQRA